MILAVTPPRPWFRLDEGFLARVLPRVSRSRIDLGLNRPFPGDGADLLRRGLAARFTYVRGRLLAVPTLSAVLAARDRRLLLRVARGLPAEAGLAIFTKPRSKEARELLRKLAEEGAHPEAAPIFLSVGDRQTALRFLKPSPEAGAAVLADAARVRATFLDDLRGARALVSKAVERASSTAEVLNVAEACVSIRGDRSAAAKLLEAARTRARNRGGLCRLAWGWGAVLGDEGRARDLLRRADALNPTGSDDPSAARDWRALLGDDAAARAALESLEGHARHAEEFRDAADEWERVFGERERALAAARKGVEAARDTRERLLFIESLRRLGDAAGARALIEEAGALATGYEISLVAEARATTLRDRKGAAEAVGKAIDLEENPWSVEGIVENVVRALGPRALRPLYDRRAKKAATFDDHLAAAKVYAAHLPDRTAMSRHLRAAEGLAAELHQKRDVARFLRENGGDLERADRLIEDALASASSAQDWAMLMDYKPGDPSLHFRKQWPRASALAGPGDWGTLLDVALTFQDPDLLLVVLEAMRDKPTDARDWLRAAEEWRERDPARAREAVERAAAGGATPLDVADAWTKAGRPEKAVEALPDLEAAAEGDVLAMGRCAQIWHAAGDEARARACLERASAAAARAHEYSACGTLWQNLFGDLARADACHAKAGGPAGPLDVRLPGFLAGIRNDPIEEISEVSEPAAVGF